MKVVVAEYDRVKVSAWFVRVDPVQPGMVPSRPQPHRPVTGQVNIDPSRVRLT